jgi:hypothetical protein
MGVAKHLSIAGVLVLLTVSLTPAQAQQVSVRLENLGSESEPGSGTALVNLGAGTVEIDVSGLQAVPHDNPLGSRAHPGVCWLVG